MKHKNVVLKAEHHRFQKDMHIQLGPLVRDYLDEHIASNTLDELPKRTQRRNDIEAVRTSIMVEQRHELVIDKHDINLSQVIDDILASRLKRERTLANLEAELDGGES